MVSASFHVPGRLCLAVSRQRRLIFCRLIKGALALCIQQIGRVSTSFIPLMFFSFRAILPVALTLILPSTHAQDAAAGQAVYMQVCFACHQPTGLGLPGMFPPLAGSDWINAAKPDRLIRIVLHGITGPLQLNGQPFNSPAPLMPPQGTLSDDQIANVLTYVRTNFGNQASAVSAAEVKAIRESEKARTAMWTQVELEKIPVN